MSLLNSMLDTSMDEVETAAEFLDFPAGEYMLEITKAEAKEYPAKDDKPASVSVGITYAIVETIALQDANQEPAEEGSLNSERFNLNEQGLPYFKRYLTNIFGEVEGTSLGESINALKGMQITCLVKSREYKGTNYMSTARQVQA